MRFTRYPYIHLLQSIIVLAYGNSNLILRIEDLFSAGKLTQLAVHFFMYPRTL